MKKYTQTIFLLVGLVVSLFLLLSQQANADTAPFNLINISPNSNFAIVNQSTIYYYLLKNNQSKTVFFNFTPHSPGLHINQRFSTCTYGLASGASCKLIISFDATNKLGPVQTELNITTKDNQLIKIPLVFNVVAKPITTATNADIGSTWQETGPYGGPVTDVAISPNDPNTLFAATFGAGVFKSTDGGNNWSPINNGMTGLYIQQLIINHGVLYAVPYPGRGIYKSMDDGAHWITINGDLPFSIKIVELAVDNNTLFASDESGNIFRSIDAGAHWAKVMAINYPVVVRCISILIKGNVIYAGTTGAGVLKSIDNGKTWSLPFSNTELNNRSISTLFDDNGILYAGTYNLGTPDSTVFKSMDGGNHWTLASNGLGFSNISSFTKEGKTIYAGANFSSLSVGVHGGVFKTTDGGATWVRIASPIENPDFSVNKIMVNNATLYTATPAGLYKSTNDGVQWTAINNGINANEITSMLAVPHAIYVGTASSGAFKSTDSGITWRHLNTQGAIDASLAIFGITSDNNENIYLNYTIPQSQLPYLTSGISKSYDGGENWISLILPPCRPNTIPIATTLLSADSSLYFGTSLCGVYKSLDGGSSWQQFGLDFPKQQIININIAVFNNMLYASVFDTSSRIYKTSLSGTQPWTSLGNLPSAFDMINALIPINKGPLANSLLVVTSKGIYVTKDGQNWVTLNNGFSSSIAIRNVLQLSDSIFIAGTLDGVYKSDDSGNHWQKENDNLNQGILNNLAKNNDFIFAGTATGVYRKDLQSFIN